MTTPPPLPEPPEEPPELPPEEPPLPPELLAEPLPLPELPPAPPPPEPFEPLDDEQAAAIASAVSETPSNQLPEAIVVCMHDPAYAQARRVVRWIR